MEKSKSGIPASVKAYKKIKDDILSNRLKPGFKLVESNLAEELNVSRTPVREALKQLDQDGLITYIPQKGSIVSQISKKNAQELYEVREVLEGLAIKLICMNLNKDNLKVFEDIVIKMHNALLENNYDEHVLLHKKWTETILNLTDNGILKNDLISLNQNLGRMRLISLANSKQNTDAYFEILKIFEAMKDKNPDECERLARIHVKNAWQRFNLNTDL